MVTPVALTIAGSDPSGGAGIQADLKTFHQLGVYGTAAITLITVQNTRRVSRVEVLPPDLVAEQIQAVLEDIEPHAIKTGALGSASVIEAIARLKLRCRLILDPVMISKHGSRLLDENARRALILHLLPQAELITPNLSEAAELTGIEVNTPEKMREAAQRIGQLGPRAVLVKGGHLPGQPIDILWESGVFHEFSGERYQTPHTHGTGCTFSAAITAYRARNVDMLDAVERAKQFIDSAIRNNPGLGSGNGPVNHWAPL